MKNTFVIYSLYYSMFKVLFPADIEIKSLKAYTDNKTSLPVLVNGDQLASYLNIDFDIDAVTIPTLKIVFRFCDKNWIQLTMCFCQTMDKMFLPELDVFNLPDNIEGARYRYEGSFPDEKGFVTLPFSGKWKFFITDSYDTSVVYAIRKIFCYKSVN